VGLSEAADCNGMTRCLKGDHQYEKCKKLEETIQRVATNTIGYTRKQANKEWFDEECAKVNEEKNATRKQAIQIKARGAKNANKLARTKERRLFRKNALIDIERHRSIQDHSHPPRQK
jgi:hypothetical protein